MNFTITDDFVGVFQDYFPNDLCDRYIQHFDQMEKLNLTNDRTALTSKHVVDDRAVNLVNSSFYHGTNINHLLINEFTSVLWGQIYEEYSKKYSILKDFAPHQVYEIKLQKTQPGEGYHLWHSESNSRMHSNRILVFSLYLNTVEEGGETEFLYLKKRFRPVKNRLLIWPSGFTHTHRGNPPLSNDKYIITGWIEF